MGAIHRHITVGKIFNTLRAIEADRPDRIASDLHERLRYTLATSAGRSTPRDAYSPFVARALRDAARTDVEAMFRRPGADDRTAEGEPAIDSPPPACHTNHPRPRAGERRGGAKGGE